LGYNFNKCISGHQDISGKQIRILRIGIEHYVLEVIPRQAWNGNDPSLCSGWKRALRAGTPEFHSENPFQGEASKVLPDPPGADILHADYLIS
jgi:hypothetical protein